MCGSGMSAVGECVGMRSRGPEVECTRVLKKREHSSLGCPMRLRHDSFDGSVKCTTRGGVRVCRDQG